MWNNTNQLWHSHKHKHNNSKLRLVKKHSKVSLTLMLQIISCHYATNSSSCNNKVNEDKHDCRNNKISWQLVIVKLVLSSSVERYQKFYAMIRILKKVSWYSILSRDLIVRTINLISCFSYCRLCYVSAIIHAVTTSFYDELTDLLDRLAVLILLILLLI